MTRKQIITVSVITLFVLACAAFVWRIQQQERQIQALHARCVSAMMNQICSVTNQRTETAVSSAPVFVAGFGPVDATFYSRWQRTDVDMCGEIRSACADDQKSMACRLGNTLYPER